MSEADGSKSPKAEVQNLSGFLDRLRDVLDPEALAKATAALKPEPEPVGQKVAADDPAQEKPASVEGVSNLTRILELGVTALISVGLALALFTFVAKPSKPAISFATLDANIAVAKYLETPGVADLDEQAFGAAVSEFHKALEVEMKQFSINTGRVLLSGSVIFAGDVPDVTDKLTALAIGKVAKK
jgi:Type-F conjugative transfer system protein (TrbI_Ftype)